MPLEYMKFVRKPFTVEAIKITDENIAELAYLIGRLEKLPDGTKYIKVDAKKIQNIEQVYIGYWITKMGNTVHCYASKVFFDQFAFVTPEVKASIDAIAESSKNKIGSTEEVEAAAG